MLFRHCVRLAFLQKCHPAPPCPVAAPLYVRKFSAVYRSRSGRGIVTSVPFRPTCVADVCYFHRTTRGLCGRPLVGRRTLRQRCNILRSCLVFCGSQTSAVIALSFPTRLVCRISGSRFLTTKNARHWSLRHSFTRAFKS